jgi:hypothetical protein
VVTITRGQADPQCWTIKSSPDVCNSDMVNWWRIHGEVIHWFSSFVVVKTSWRAVWPLFVPIPPLDFQTYRNLFPAVPGVIWSRLSRAAWSGKLSL